MSVLNTLGGPHRDKCGKYRCKIRGTRKLTPLRTLWDNRLNAIRRVYPHVKIKWQTFQEFAEWAANNYVEG